MWLAVSSDEEDDVVEAGGAPAKGMSKTIGLRVQKKLMGMGVKSKEAAKHFIDDESGGRTCCTLVVRHAG